MLKLLPTIGILMFIGLYVYAAQLYPGGSQADPNSVGFDWFQNLWCNLMSETAINGEQNPARSISLFAVVVVCSSLILFFFQFTRFFVKSRNWKLTIKITGVVAMLSALFIFTKYHDLMTTILSLCGLVGITAMIRALHINKMTFLKITGIICLIFIGLNNLCYYNERFSDYLPIVQQIDIFLVLAWTVGINLQMLNKS